MTDPTREDTYQGTSCLDMASKSKDPKDTYATWGWQPSGLEETQKAVYSVGYPDERLHFVVGPVEQTLPEQAPAQVALLRLDTDFYKSTLHELEHLYPRMPRGGVLIIDDYGHADGVRLAVDQFFRQNDLPILLNRIDYTGRVGVKL
jgi:predicted O-methyltransferase YrrM